MTANISINGGLDAQEITGRPLARPSHRIPQPKLVVRGRRLGLRCGHGNNRLGQHCRHAVISQTGSTRMNHVAKRQRAWPPSAGSHGFAQLTGVVNEMRIGCDEVSHDHVKARNESAVLPRGATRAERSGGRSTKQASWLVFPGPSDCPEVSRGHSATGPAPLPDCKRSARLASACLGLWHAYCPPLSCPHECEKKNARKRMPDLRRP